MTELKLKLLTDAVRIYMMRDKITAEEALANYPALTETEKAAIAAAVDGGNQ